MLRVPLLRSRSQRWGVKIVVVVCGLLWCGSGPIHNFLPGRAARMFAEDRSEFDQVVRRAQAGEALEARAALTRMLAAEPRADRKAVLQSWIAWCSELAGDATAQIEAARAGLAALPDEPDLVVLYAKGLAARRGPGDLALAQSALERAIGQARPRQLDGPRRHDMNRVLASVRLLRGDLTGARAAADAAGRSSLGARGTAMPMTFARASAELGAGGPGSMPLAPAGAGTPDQTYR
ncbi:MAG: hypothetical protein HY815_24130 [Candidatus Riflebacteria bacterium]|nr:hypothetical protein [Candidatus Riflebacteria bacterium]